MADAVWGYSKDEPEGRIFEDGKLSKGYFPSPAMVPGSDAEKKHREDAEREGVSLDNDKAKP